MQGRGDKAEQVWLDWNLSRKGRRADMLTVHYNLGGFVTEWVIKDFERGGGLVK